MNEEDKICALCQWNKNDGGKFFCGHKDQGSERLKGETSYNDGCGLFEEREDRRTMYDFMNVKKDEQ